MIGSTFNVAVLISGHTAGEPPATRDYEITGHKYFLVLSDLLVKKGYAVVRYDNRGVGDSSGDYKSVTDEDFALDAATVLKWAKSNPLFHTAAVGFIGHSQGGVKAQLASLREQPDYIVALGSGVEELSKTIERQTTEINLASGIDGVENESQLEEIRALFSILKTSPTYEISSARIKSYVLAKKPEISANELAEVFELGIGSKWFYAETRRDLKRLVADFDQPMLQLFGTKDLLVSAHVNAPLTAPLLRHKDSKVHVFDGVNHLFQLCDVGGPNEYWKIETTIEQYVVDYIDNWIQSLDYAP